MHQKSPSNRRPSREKLAAQFWNEVRDRLIDHYRRSPDQADLGVGRYRHETERRDLGETVYNQGVETVAEVVNDVIENGLPEPS